MTNPHVASGNTAYTASVSTGEFSYETTGETRLVHDIEQVAAITDPETRTVQAARVIKDAGEELRAAQRRRAAAALTLHDVWGWRPRNVYLLLELPRSTFNDWRAEQPQPQQQQLHPELKVPLNRAIRRQEQDITTILSRADEETLPAEARAVIDTLRPAVAAVLPARRRDELAGPLDTALAGMTEPLADVFAAHAEVGRLDLLLDEARKVRLTGILGLKGLGWGPLAISVAARMSDRMVKYAIDKAEEAGQDIPTAVPPYKAAADRIRGRIQAGQESYRPGEQLPGEHRLAADLGVPRHAIAVALRSLRDDGLVESRRRIGWFVVAPPATD